MRRSFVFWILALVLTLASAIYQRVTGPTYPVAGSAELAETTVSYTLARTHGGETNHPVRIETGDVGIEGTLEWKRHKTSEAWTVVPMKNDGGVLAGELPNQPPAGKLDYLVRLRSGEDQAVLPAEGGVVIRFKGDVPLFVLIPHVIAMFGAMLLSTRAGLEYFSPKPELRVLIYWTLGLLAVGGLILGPIVQKYAFDAYWTGWPIGHDLTDNKTFVAFLAWVIAAVALAKVRKPEAWALGAAIVVLIIFLIPHSMFGSELKYEDLDQEKPGSHLLTTVLHDAPIDVATFSIVGRDSATGELGVAVASRFFAVGSVVPWAKAGVGAVATQAFANTTFGWRGLDLMEMGKAPAQALDELLAPDEDRERRQVGMVSAGGSSSTYTGKGCLAWAGGRSGPNYAAQGNILGGEKVVVAMEHAFLTTKGTLADRLYAALLAGEKNGGDSRGKQSAALLVVRKGAGYGGFTDRAIDIRVDDHQEPFRELGRLLEMAQMNYAWNEGWTLFTQKRFAEALPVQERAALLGARNPEVLYDLAVIRLAAGEQERALDALENALQLNPKLRIQASKDNDLESLRTHPRFIRLVKPD